MHFVKCRRRSQMTSRMMKNRSTIMKLQLFVVASYVQEEEMLFPKQIWNQREAAAEGFVRTTNCVAGWHNGLQSLFQCAHPTMWYFFSGLVKETELALTQYFQHISGQRIPMKNKYK